MNAVLNNAPQIQKGLEGVIADATSVSDVDGDAGRLYYRGYAIESLTKYSFAAVAHLIVFGDLPTAQQESRLEEYLWRVGQLPPFVASTIATLAATPAHPMEILQAVAPLLGVQTANDSTNESPPASIGPLASIGPFASIGRGAEENGRK
ncbi:MAG TPA: citrate/2-methylcitrate synthase [Steroidobacteraceae bacterium]|nr:citrate/2-methylcitrate synthase [Steroidobacteraceae bacterium]